MVDQYAWYRAALGGVIVIHDDGAVHAGFFKRRYKLTDGSGKYGPWLGAAIWREGERLVCRVGSKMCDPSEEWLYLAKHPVPAADVRHFFAHGRWPAEPDMTVSTIEIADLAKAWRSAKADAAIRAEMVAFAARVYRDTGKLPLGFEIATPIVQEIAA